MVLIVGIRRRRPPCLSSHAGGEARRHVVRVTNRVRVGDAGGDGPTFHSVDGCGVAGSIAVFPCTARQTRLRGPRENSLPNLIGLLRHRRPIGLRKLSIFPDDIVRAVERRLLERRPRCAPRGRH